MIASGLTFTNSTKDVDEPLQLLEKVTVYAAVAGTADELVSVPAIVLCPEPDEPLERPAPTIGAAHE